MKIHVIEQKKKEKRKLRVCAYCRVSTDSDEQEGSLNNQKSYYEELIQSNPEYEYQGVYYDFGISGFKENRPGFQKMLTEAKSGNIDLIITKSVSRFARNTHTTLKEIRELKSIGVGIFFELQNINTLYEEGEVLITLLSAFAQAESESNSGNVKMSIRRKFEQGIPMFPISKIYGYKENKKGEVVINEEEAKIVREMYRLVIEGVWASKIAKYFNSKNIPSPKGVTWGESTIAKMVRNEVYKGDRILQKMFVNENRRVRHNRGEVNQYQILNNHPAIVSRKTWQAAQEALEKRSIAYLQQEPVEKVKHSSHSTYALSNRLICPYCGCKLYHKWDSDQRFEYWMCSTHLKVSKERCPGVYVPQKNVEHLENKEGSFVVVKKENKYFMTEYEFFQKEEYEQKHKYPFEYHKPIKEKKKKPEKRKQIRRIQYERTPDRADTRKSYPLSRKLYCPFCGKVMSHSWEGNVPYWQCSTNRNRYRSKDKTKCKGLFLPAEISDAWGEINEKITVIPYYDEVGNRYFKYMPKEEYELSEDCPYGKESKCREK